MKDIVYTLEFSDTLANKRANEYLAKGWTLVEFVDSADYVNLKVKKVSDVSMSFK